MPTTASPRSSAACANALPIPLDTPVTNERDSRQLARLDGGRDDIHDHDVLVEDVESTLARRRVVAGGHDEDVLALDLVEAAPAHLDV